jgi:hypothetical protein
MINIRNCVFGFKCTADWDVMERTQNALVRHCLGCKKDVYQVSTKEELYEAIELNRCVAIFDAINESEKTLNSLGVMVRYDSDEADNLPRPTLGVPARYKTNEELDFDKSNADDYDIPAFLRKNNYKK